MKATSPVLVVTALDDPTADLVIGELHDRSVPVVRFDAADFPRDLSVSARVGAGGGISGSLRTPSREADLSSARSLYYRRPSGFDFGHLDAQDARFALAQARYGFGGVLANLPNCLYVNHPHAIADAEFKPAQLATAVEAGFTVPASLITNDPAEARAFAAEHDRVVYKPLRPTPYHVGGQARAVWVREIHPDELDDSAAWTAHLFQEVVSKIADLRITVIGNRVFCVRIDTDDPALLDWRYHYDQLSYTAVDPPPGLTEGLCAYLKHFGLVFGCFDFTLTPGGDAVYLECNPNGQWAWLEEPTGLPMTTALADLLEKRQP